MTFNRRDALIGLGAGAAALVGCSAARQPRASRARGLSELAARLRDATRDETLGIATAAVRDGADHEALLTATFLAGVDGLHPLPGMTYHPVIMIESSFELAGPAPRREALLGALWNLDDLKLSQDTDPRSPWRMPPRPEVPRASAAEARAEFVAAMEAWDRERADRAVVGLMPHVDAEGFFEILWPLAARCFAHIGHKPIYAAQAQRVLARIGWEHGEPVARSLVIVLLRRRDTKAFPGSVERAKKLSAGWDRGTNDPAKSVDFLPELRTATPDEARELVACACEDGLGTDTIWDGLRLFASELFHRRAGKRSNTGRVALLPVHAVTVIEAFGHVWRTTSSDETRRVVLLQAAAFLAGTRDGLGRVVDLSMEGPGIDALGDDEDEVALEDALALASPGAVRAHLDRNPESGDRYLAHLRSSLVRTGIEHHQHKYAAAVQVESRRVHPRWSSRMLAPAVDYVAHPEDPDDDVYLRAEDALRRAGV